MVQELFFEILHKRQHIFIDAKDSSQVLELKKILEGILKVPPNKQILVRFPHEQNFAEFVPLDDKRTLGEVGYTSQNAKAQAPAPIGLFFEGENGPDVAELSSPPPIPDAMRGEHPQE